MRSNNANTYKYKFPRYGTGVAGAKPAEALREMAKQIGDRDNSVRNAALNAITETYFQVNLH